MFVGIARPTSAAKVFKDRDSLKAEVEEYCRSPAEYEESDGREKYGPIEKWDVSAVTNMEYLFSDTSCNPPISKWNVRSVKTFAEMFNGAQAFNQDISEWDVSSSESFMAMFYGAEAFDQDLSRWDVSNGKWFDGMFHVARAFDQDLSRWDVSNGENFELMFRLSGMNHSIGGWQIRSKNKGQTFLGMLHGTDDEYDTSIQLLNIATFDIAEGCYFSC